MPNYCRRLTADDKTPCGRAIEKANPLNWCPQCRERLPLWPPDEAPKRKEGTTRELGLCTLCADPLPPFDTRGRCAPCARAVPPGEGKPEALELFGEVRP